MKTNEENRGIPNWMRYKSASVDLSKSETYLSLAGVFQTKRENLFVSRCFLWKQIH